MIRNSILVLALALAAASPAAAHDPSPQDIAVEQPWSRATAPSAPNGAAFMTIRNSGHEADRLVSAASRVAERVELHTHRMEDGVMKMRQVEAIDIPAEGEAVLKPGGLHVMMFGLKAPLVQGETFPVKLTFEKAGTRTVEVSVMGAGSRAPMGHDQGEGHGAGHGGGQPMHGHK